MNLRRAHLRAFAILCVLAAGFAYVGPTSAFEYATFSRAATVSVVSDANAYNALSSSASPLWTCTGSAISSTQCTVGIITNKGADGQAYRLMKETDTGTRIQNWALGGVAAVSSTSSPWTQWTAERVVGSTTAIIVNVSSCVVSCSTTYANLTVEGQKADVLEFNETRIMIIVKY